MKADVSFLASDLLEGRATPSRGLDVAAEYIASQFRRAGLQSAGDDGYFQSARFEQASPNLEGLELTLEIQGRTIHVPATAMSVQSPAAVDLNRAEVIKTGSDTASLNALTPDQVRGKVLIVETPFWMRRPELRPALLLLLRPVHRVGGTPPLTEAGARPVPTLAVWDEAFRKTLAAAKPGPVDATISAHIAPPAVTPVNLHNVIGILPGSDPLLKDTYVLVTAHYDHLGISGSGPGDHIFNGANDDASGTASVIEIAETLASLPEKPKRTIVFMTFFGEEMGEIGSHYYVNHPVFPLARTIADINLEQLGRTDDTHGRHQSTLNLTGFDYTDLPGLFRDAGAKFGIQVVKDAANSNRYFTMSDNSAFAAAGVPSTTASVTYDFPDYHAVGDEWPKLDYENMAKVDRALALAIYDLAGRISQPHWTEIPETERFRRAAASRADASSR